ncbi:MAG TPA: hypothetical protein VMU68_04010 [Acidimicrobiales bacterium]|nr:hypothetical protein [Acidimicrobiales bacterium]
MRARQLVVILAVVALGTGLFFAGRASVSTTSNSSLNRSKYIAVTFSPISVDFTSVLRGWALGIVPCHHKSHCLSLRMTTDAGGSWLVVPLPSALLQLADRKVDGIPAVMGGSLDDDNPAYLSVRFANARDGWIYGSLETASGPGDAGSVSFLTVIWTTHDGGLVWHSLSRSSMHDQDGVLDLEATSNTVYALALSKSFRVALESSPVHRNQWRVVHTTGLGTPAGGGPLSGAIVFSGPRGWLVEGNDRGTSGSARLTYKGIWVPWRPPCESVGNSLAVPAASTQDHLIAECQMGGFASPLSRAAPRGAKLGSTWLYVSNNSGRTFAPVRELGPSSEYFGPTLAVPRPETFVITGRNVRRQDLLASFDNGREWNIVYIGNVMFMRFVSPNEGAALVQSPNGPNQLIMTFDGGYDWLPVAF